MEHYICNTQNEARSQDSILGGAETQKVDLLDLTPLIKPHFLAQKVDPMADLGWCVAPPRACNLLSTQNRKRFKFLM